MKITSVDIIDVANDFASATSKWRPVVVKINTDEGISGFGEVGLAYGVGASAGIGMAKDLAAIIIGMDPMNNEAIWEKITKLSGNKCSKKPSGGRAAAAFFPRR